MAGMARDWASQPMLWRRGGDPHVCVATLPGRLLSAPCMMHLCERSALQPPALAVVGVLAMVGGHSDGRCTARPPGLYSRRPCRPCRPGTCACRMICSTASPCPLTVQAWVLPPLVQRSCTAPGVNGSLRCHYHHHLRGAAALQLPLLAGTTASLALLLPQCHTQGAVQSTPTRHQPSRHRDPSEGPSRVSDARWSITLRTGGRRGPACRTGRGEASPC